jgi:hypothetical protein
MPIGRLRYASKTRVTTGKQKFTNGTHGLLNTERPLEISELGCPWSAE